MPSHPNPSCPVPLSKEVKGEPKLVIMAVFTLMLLRHKMEPDIPICGTSVLPRRGSRSNILTLWVSPITIHPKFIRDSSLPVAMQ
jgi:hypothetical protein